MTILISPTDPSAKPLPWLLIQTQRGNYLVGARSNEGRLIAVATFSEDAKLILYAVHAYHPMLAALRLIESELGSNEAYRGATSLSVQFDYRDFLMIEKALAIAELEEDHGH